MKRWTRAALAAALCAALLLSGLMLPGLGSASSVYLMAANDQVVEMTAENMPMMVNGTLYVPYTLLSSRSNGGVNLRLNAVYSASRRTMLVSSGQQGVTFDTQANTAYDIQGNELSVRAVVRNGMAFLPVDWLCSYFGVIGYSVIWTRYGTLVRITNSYAVLSDEDFVDAAKGKLAENLRSYQESIAPSATPTPTPAPRPTPTSTPAPTPPVVQTSVPPVASAPPEVQPSQAPQPSPEPSEEPEEGAELTLALRWGEQGEQAARLLEERGLRALFLLTGEELREQDDAVRRLVGAGHSVGLVLTGTDGEECLDQAREGRKLLAGVARCGTVVACADGADQAGRDALREAGYVLWTASVRGERYSSGEALVRGLNPNRLNYVELDCGAAGLSFLRSALNAMDSANCTVRQATAPMLGA